MTSLDILNSIRLDLDAEYQARIPQATRENIQEVGNTLVGSNANNPYFNKFFSNLINRIGKVMIEKMDALEEVFANFGRKIDLNLGDAIQKIYIDIPTAHAFDGTATTSMLSQERGTIYVEYTRIDRKLFYKQTVGVDEIREAFTSLSALEDFVRGLIEAMTTALGVDRYYMTLEVIDRHCKYVNQCVEAQDTYNRVHAYELVVPESVCYYDKTAGKLVWGNTGAKDFLKGLRVATRTLKFPHALSFLPFAYDSVSGSDKVDLTKKTETGHTNEYKELQTISKVRTPLGSQRLALEVSTLAEIDVDALAVLFNLDKAEVKTQTIELEDGSIGIINAGADNEKYVLGFIADTTCLEKVTSLEEADSFKNPESRAVNYWLHYWGAMAVSKFKDFMPIVVKAITPVVEGQ